MSDEKFTTPTTERYKEIVEKHGGDHKSEKVKAALREHGFEVEQGKDGKSPHEPS
jgi:hypothetical protein